jgi:hypothetical protein
VNNAGSASWQPAGAGGGRWLFPALLGFGGAATIATAMVTNGSILATMAPVLGLAALAAIWVAPLRLTLFALAFLALAPDGTDDGPWNSPLAPIGRLLNHNLNKTIPIGALAVPLVTCALLFLLVIHLNRVLTKSRIEEVSPQAIAVPMRLALAASLLAVVLELLNGFRHGGNMQMAKIQVQNYVLILLVAYLMAASLRGLRDYRTLGTVFVVAACIKAAMAVFVYVTMDPHPAVATTHGDSLLFTSAVVILIGRFWERPVWRNGMLCVSILPLLFLGMVANNRRLAWVQLAASLLTLYFVSRRSLMKRFVARSVLVALPLIGLYVAAGWNSSSKIFAPVKVFRSVGDADTDGSTLFRDLENYNLLYTLRMNPVIGTGFGHMFAEEVVTPDISFFKEYHYLPHNSILGLWCFTGVIGFTGLFTALVTGVHLAARSYYQAQVPEERAAAFTAVSVVVIYLIHCYGDIGWSERESIFLVGSALAVAGQLAVTTGQWPGHPAAVAPGRPR